MAFLCRGGFGSVSLVCWIANIACVNREPVPLCLGVPVLRSRIISKMFLGLGLGTCCIVVSTRSGRTIVRECFGSSTVTAATCRSVKTWARPSWPCGYQEDARGEWKQVR